VVDEQAALGVATTRVEERLLASVGQLQAAPIRFEAVDDVPSGGVLCALPAPEPPEPQTMADYEKEKGKLLEQIQRRQQQIEQLKTERKAALKHVPLKDLPPDQRFAQLRTTKKHFVDTLKLIAYRAETALAQVVREKLPREQDARSLVRQVLTTAVDLRPDTAQKTLTVRLHRLSSPGHDEVLEHLCQELTVTETTFPGTDLRLIYQPVGAKEIPRDQDS